MASYIERRKFLATFLGGAAAGWPLAAVAQSMTQPIQATTANPPQIEVARVKPIDPAAPKLRFQLSDGSVDLTKSRSLGGVDDRVNRRLLGLFCCTAYVGSWHIADNKFSARNVRFWGIRDAGNHAVNCHSARIGLRTGAELSATSGNPMILVV